MSKQEQNQKERHAPYPINDYLSKEKQKPGNGS